ncbi:MAG: crotonase/enoyl-CoA hydratase family protein [Alcaligenaceae bacterium]|nr:crotonase/enoyl-CoA hydratase family protein [Alcaligenaceae bacterium]
MEQSPLIVEVEDHIMTMTLNRPNARNAANIELATLMAEAIDRLESDNDLRVGILTGAGGNFCAGMDLKRFATDGSRPSLPGRGFCGITEKQPGKVLIAAIEGYALAGGFELALACDLIVASNQSRFGLPEVKRGLVAAAGGVMRLPRRIPYHIAMECILTGDMLEAETAHSYGLINRLVAPGEALNTAKELAKAISRNGPLAVAASKKVVMSSPEWAPSEMFARQSEIISPVFDSADAKEGALAFTEKREPNWKGV